MCLQSLLRELEGCSGGISLLAHERVACNAIVDAVIPDASASDAAPTAPHALSAQAAEGSRLRHVLASSDAWRACTAAPRGTPAAAHAVHALLELASDTSAAQVWLWASSVPC